MLRKLLIKPGFNRENTRYTNEGSWYDGDKVRFRQGSPEKIGGWTRLSSNTFNGVCRALWNWVSLLGANYMGVGTNTKLYIELGGVYNDVTPIRATHSLTGPFGTTSGSPTVLVTDTAHGAKDGDFVTFSGATAVGGLTISGEYQIALIDVNTYSITAASNASGTATGGGTVSAVYQINSGPAGAVPMSGWGSGGWGTGTWGVGTTSSETVRLWSLSNFGEDLIACARGGTLYIWAATNGLTTRAVLLSSQVGATDVPNSAGFVLVADSARYLFAFGTNDYLSSTYDPLLIRWAAQDSAVNWTPGETSSSASLRLSRGSQIVQAVQTRQEILVFTDTTLYSMTNVGYPAFWGAQPVASNISIASPNAAMFASGVTYWMGNDKFYKYDGTVSTLDCDVRKYVFNDINTTQLSQIFSGTNEAFTEVWWFYCSANSSSVNKYVVYNYKENLWYYGTMARTAWIETGLRSGPMAATYSNNLVYHETGYDDNESGTPTAINAYATSAEFDLDDGHQFMFITRMLPDMTFEGSTGANPSATITLLPLINSGSGYTSPTSEGGTNTSSVVQTQLVPVEQFTGQVYVRVRARQMAMQVASSGLGVAWQLGAPRLDMRPDGRRG